MRHPTPYPEIALWRELSAELGENIAQLNQLGRDPKRNEPADKALKADLRRRIADVRRRIDALCDKEVNDSEDNAVRRPCSGPSGPSVNSLRGKKSTGECRQEIQNKLRDLKGVEQQECGTGKPNHPSAKPSVRDRYAKRR